MKLPICQKCDEIQYPIREICGNCLSDDLQMQEISATATLLSKVELNHSLEETFLNHLPWPVGTVILQGGARMMVHLSDNKMTVGDEVELQPITDPKGRSVMLAKPLNDKESANDISWHELENKGI